MILPGNGRTFRVYQGQNAVSGGCERRICVPLRLFLRIKQAAFDEGYRERFLRNPTVWEHLSPKQAKRLDGVKLALLRCATGLHRSSLNKHNNTKTKKRRTSRSETQMQAFDHLCLLIIH